VTNLHRRLKKLELLLTDVRGLVPHTEKWLDYWRCWLDRYVNDSDFRPNEKMPLAAARALIQSSPNSDDLYEAE
jgi:hypothetical protein